ncbi:glycosyl transferase family 2 [Pseudopedobacter saltans DSM 12145]|uniref:Glycosyl transferase family 2 n=1 Tax=Pseudopedobacter saltans (strain ATCC 51119 / DSM 12145 / JCM 21818 / CCUG 39354 / LMG 10337 / NBRC 100064 / NCIMB 13643) TaxID=762903 RepID=F0S7S2_PSESL|nr:glycosyltransferase family 2 protein [Pseudopedobacter saltans]ADY53327.1 glycosyl transferase family 2 [Pseudopedobacter saltans DSM 12145]
MNISVVINTYNAEKHLREVLESVKELDEIIICDMYSDDQTLQIAKEYNSRVIFHEKTGFVEPARNFAISQAKNDWVLLLDADETVNSKLIQYLQKTVNEKPNITCVAIPRKNYFLGKFMHSAYPDYVYRFFKKDKVFWPEFIHSIPKIDGDIFKIKPGNKSLAIEHLANDSIEAIENKSNAYSTAELPKRQHKKVTVLKLIFSPFFWFFKYYVIKQGFKDGKAGFLFAALKARYKFLTLAKLTAKQIQ